MEPKIGEGDGINTKTLKYLVEFIVDPIISISISTVIWPEP